MLSTWSRACNENRRSQIRAARPRGDPPTRASIYDPAATELTGLFHTPYELELLLRTDLIGRRDLADLPVRTRSKVAKTIACEALGYVPPTNFQKVSPRLRHANVDIYSQQSNNLQIWNQEVDAARRYVILILLDGVISDIKVIAGADLAQYDTTGTLTSNFQANRIHEGSGSSLVSLSDTPDLARLFNPSPNLTGPVSPVAPPAAGKVLDIRTVYDRLLPLVGMSFANPGPTQERNRGMVVHREACALLGLSHFADNGQFPDLLSQLLEVKLQLARTVDLGLELPESTTPVASTNGILAVADMRYAILYGERSGVTFAITELVVVTGKDFFKEFEDEPFGSVEVDRFGVPHTAQREGVATVAGEQRDSPREPIPCLAEPARRDGDGEVMPARATWARAEHQLRPPDPHPGAASGFVDGESEHVAVVRRRRVDVGHGQLDTGDLHVGHSSSAISVSRA